MNTTANIPGQVNVVYNRNLLTRAVPYFVHTKFAQVRDIPQKSGTMTIKFRRYSNLLAATKPLQEGVTPVGKKMSVTDITATVQQYGDYIEISDVLDFTNIDNTLLDASDLLGDQMGDTLDQLTRDVVNSGTNVQRAGARLTRGAILSTDKVSATDLKKIVRTLKNNLAKKLTAMIVATTGVNTSPVNASFIGICHTNTTYDLSNLTGWVDVEKYSSQMSVMEGEVGKISEIRFIETSNAKVFEGEGDSGIDVYSTMILGRDAYGISRISGKTVENIIKGLGSAGTADALNQRQTSGWKATFVAVILNNDFMCRYEHAVSD